jgi:hypothetical protein
MGYVLNRLQYSIFEVASPSFSAAMGFSRHPCPSSRIPGQGDTTSWRQHEHFDDHTQTSPSAPLLSSNAYLTSNAGEHSNDPLVDGSFQHQSADVVGLDGKKKEQVEVDVVYIAFRTDK